MPDKTGEIIVPLQPHEIKAGLNNSPGYRHHIFQCSGRSLWGLHPIPLRHLAMLSSDERAELLAECEQIELNWDADEPLDEKWRYKKTRESLKKHFGSEIGTAPKSDPNGKSPDHVRQGPLNHPVHDATNPPRHKHQARPAFDSRASERDRILELIGPRDTTQWTLAKMSLKTASEEELLRAAESFKTSADTIEKRLDFLPFVFDGGSSANSYESRPKATHETTASASPLGGAPGIYPHKSTPEATWGNKVQDQQAPVPEANKGKMKSTSSVVCDDDNDTDTSLSEFQLAVAAAANENPLSVSSLIANWEIKPLTPKAPASTSGEEVLVDTPAAGAVGTTLHLDDDAVTVESLDCHSDSEGGHLSHDFWGMSDSFSEVGHVLIQENDEDHNESSDSEIKLPHLDGHGPGPDMMSQSGEGDIHHSTPNEKADAPWSEKTTLSPAQCSASDDPQDADEEAASEDDIEDTPASVASDMGSRKHTASESSHTTHLSLDEGTRTPEAPLLIMPTFPLSTASEGLHEAISNHAAQVLRKSSHRFVRKVPTNDRSSGTAPSIESAIDQERTADDGTIGQNATEGATARPHQDSEHTTEGHNEYSLSLSYDEHTHHPTPISEHLDPPPPNNLGTQLAQHTSLTVSNHAHSEDPVFEAVVFPIDNEHENDELYQGPAKVNPDAPLSLAFSDDNVDDWAQDLVATFHGHTISHASVDQHERPALPVEEAILIVDAAEATPEETGSPRSERDEGSPLGEAIPPVHIPGAVDDGDVAKPHIDHFEAPEDRPFEAQSSQEVRSQGNASSAPYEEVTNQPPPIDTPAVNNNTMTPTEWAELIHLADHRPLEPGSPLDALFVPYNPMEANGIYPLHVPQPAPESHHKSVILSYAWIAWEHATYYFAAYIFVGVINPTMRAPRDLYLIVGAVLSGAWVVLKCFQRRSTQACGKSHSPKQANKKTGLQRWVKVCGVMLGVAVVMTAMVFGWWPVENAGMGTTTSATTNTHEETNANVLMALDDELIEPITTSGFGVPISTTPQELTTTSILVGLQGITDECNTARYPCPEYGTESEDDTIANPEHDSDPTTNFYPGYKTGLGDAPDSEHNSESDSSSTTTGSHTTSDSYGAPNSVVRVDPLQLSGPMAGLLVSVPLAYLAKYSIWLWKMRTLT
ncbi:uncharacterized protein N0V89_010616 [Didymosphaeria variabile]|uniref:Uncharacterized protein n=1 Tax=Didymosphaeria variabile TaxID=1932322 RepID=A0A9W9C5N6_9PLEO|nr:uncharacterized protein N0V89_010616 [Didymosphaeria variabile]KAJ4346685.1 hypothetical protein N0V89_010616 [Didymosphaeria variabile]